jgi:hypothetical protein
MAGTSISATIYAAVVRWGVRIGVALMVILFILVHMHMVHGENLIVLISALILLLSEQGHESTREFHKETESINGEIDKLKGEIDKLKVDVGNLVNSVDNLVDVTTPRLVSLNDCIVDMALALRSIPAGETILIEHFGLDMTQAWLIFEPVLRTQLHFAKVDYRLLMMSGELAEMDIANEEVKSWALAASWSLEKIKRDVVSMLKDPNQKCGDVKFETRTYVSVPVVHGLRIVSPIKRCYVAVCRWGGTDYRRYDWGEPQYHTIVGDPPNATSQDLLKIYNGYFQHYWENSTTAWVEQLPCP